MARPDIKQERREQILDAFETCVAKYGVEGATLAKTAEEAGLARPLVRHNVGNREKLIDTLVDRFLQRSSDAMDQMLEALPENESARTAVEWLFDPHYSDPRSIQVSYALISYSAVDPNLADRMQVWLQDFVSKIEDLLATAFPDAAPERVAAVSAGITGIYFNVESLQSLGKLDALYASSKRAALILLDALDQA